MDNVPIDKHLALTDKVGSLHKTQSTGIVKTRTGISNPPTTAPPINAERLPNC
jgi:hypothetical protein